MGPMYYPTPHVLTWARCITRRVLLTRYTPNKMKGSWGNTRDEAVESLKAHIMRKKGVTLYPSRVVQFHPHGGQFDFVRLSARTMHPHGAYVW